MVTVAKSWWWILLLLFLWVFEMFHDKKFETPSSSKQSVYLITLLGDSPTFISIFATKEQNPQASLKCL